MRKYKFISAASTSSLEKKVNEAATENWFLAEFSVVLGSLDSKYFYVVMEYRY